MSLTAQQQERLDVILGRWNEYQQSVEEEYVKTGGSLAEIEADKVTVAKFAQELFPTFQENVGVDLNDTQAAMVMAGCAEMVNAMIASSMYVQDESAPEGERRLEGEELLDALLEGLGHMVEVMMHVVQQVLRPGTV